MKTPMLMPTPNEALPPAPYGTLSLFRHFTRGEPVFHCGDPVVGLYAVKSGLVRLVHLTEEGREITVRLAGPGDVLGSDVLESSVLGRRVHHTADARCVTEVTLDYTPRESLLEGLSEGAFPDFLAQLARQLASAEMHVALSTCATDTRIRWLFGWLAPRFGVTHHGEYRDKYGDEDGCWTKLDLLLTHEDVATLVNATRVTVSYVFAQLRAEGSLTGSRGRYLVKLSPLGLNIPAETI